MASIQPRGKVFQLRVKHRLLPKAYFHTFDTELEAINYGKQLEALLDRGIVPQELLSEPKTADDPLLTQIISRYDQDALGVSEADHDLIKFVAFDKPLLGVRFSAMSYRWVESYVAWLKSVEKNVSPSSIRKRIGVLGRVIDWHIRKVTDDNTSPVPNVLRLLPRGYSNYFGYETEAAPKQDASRDRRLTPDEASQIERVLNGEKREDRERAYTDDLAFPLLYRVIIDTGLRLFEAFRLRADSIDLQKNIIKVDGSKGHRGQIKPRVVPIKVGLREPLRQWCEGRVGLLFPYWDGSKETQKKASSKLSRRFANLFDYAKVPGFTEHDMRHEAACRWFELRNDRGWVFSEIEVCRIMGWKDTRMALRYASLRGEDLSSRLDNSVIPILSKTSASPIAS
jgi:integrase